MSIGDPITPAPIPTGPAAPPLLLVFGGTFDPPHRGHIELPARVRDELERRASTPGRAWLLYVPAARSPLKEHGPIASDGDRLEMLRLALAGATLDRAAIWTDELDRAKPAPSASYTIETLSRLRAWLDDHRAAGTQIHLLIGADQAASFHRWRQPRDILRLARPVVMIRGELGDAAALGRALEGLNYWQPAELEMWRQVIAPVGRIDAGATQVREALASENARDIEATLAPAVMDYIRRRGLYRR